jgi:methionine-R-sulfoxide reductase
MNERPCWFSGLKQRDMKHSYSTERRANAFAVLRIAIVLLVVTEAVAYVSYAQDQKASASSTGDKTALATSASPGAGSGTNVPTDAELRARLSPLQYQVTRHSATEPPFRNEYWNNERPGLYVDIITGDPLFSSLDKFDSGTGWPSFSKPLEPNRVIEKVDHSFGVRAEIRSKSSDSHLGHVFDDGPPPTGSRYCMNSAALRFVPVEKLKEAGLERYLPLFEPKK